MLVASAESEIYDACARSVMYIAHVVCRHFRVEECAECVVTKWFGVTLFTPLPFTAIAHPNPTIVGYILFYLFESAGRVFTKEKLHRSALRLAALFEGRENTELSRRYRSAPQL